MAHARQQEDAAVDRFGKTVEEGALFEVLRAHGGDDVDARLGALGGFEQKLDEEGRLVLRVGPVAAAEVPEQLFELIDDDQDAAVRRKIGSLHGVEDAELARPKTGVDSGLTELRLDPLGEIADGVGAGPGDDDAPAIARGHSLAGQERHEAGADRDDLPHPDTPMTVTKWLSPRRR